MCQDTKINVKCRWILERFMMTSQKNFCFFGLPIAGCLLHSSSVGHTLGDSMRPQAREESKG